MIVTLCIAVTLKVNSTEIKLTNKVVLLGITINNKLTFNGHISNLCCTANFKLLALLRI